MKLTAFWRNQTTKQAFVKQNAFTYPRAPRNLGCREKLAFTLHQFWASRTGFFAHANFFHSWLMSLFGNIRGLSDTGVQTAATLWAPVHALGIYFSLQKRELSTACCSTRFSGHSPATLWWQQTPKTPTEPVAIQFSNSVSPRERDLDKL